jgi:hypothetical protein
VAQPQQIPGLEGDAGGAVTEVAIAWHVQHRAAALERGGNFRRLSKTGKNVLSSSPG